MSHETECRFDSLLDMPREKAFSMLVDRLDLWWSSPFADVAQGNVEAGIEPFAGGTCYEIDSAGQQRVWGTVLSIEPPLFIRIAWQVTIDGTEVADPATASRVMINFREAGEATRLEVVHSEFLRHGETGAEYLNRMRRSEGWPDTIARLKSAARSGSWR